MKVYAGLDVGKGELVVWVMGEGLRRFRNEAGGIREMREWLRAEGVKQVVCEATGGYERGVVAGLKGSGVAVHVAHPTRVRGFAQALGRGAKTDPMDAEVLAHYGAMMKVEGEEEGDGASEELREVLGRRQQLVQQRVQGTQSAGEGASGGEQEVL